MKLRIAVWAMGSVFFLGLGQVLQGAPPDKPPGEEVKVEVDINPKEAPGPDKPVHNPPSIEKRIEAMIAAYDLKPHPLEAFPDNPPPHEGALIDVPQIIDAPDLVVIEVLDALPGRPITGERLIRPDGFVNLGFYGDVHLRGLTLEQAKVKVICHLRKYLNDEVLGLAVPDEGNSEPVGMKPKAKQPIPELPPEQQLFKPGDEQAPAKPPKKASDYFPRSRGTRSRSASSEPAKSSSRRLSRRPDPKPGSPRTILTGFQEPESKENAAAPELKKGLEIPINGNTKLTITIDVQPGGANEGQGGEVMLDRGEASMTIIPPEKSDRVFVDLAAYNSRYYFVQGDVAVPGRLPCTGNETVLDALNFAGGFNDTADQKNVRLVRPARGGKPAKVYPIDIDAIMEKGDPRANLQLLPGDRLIVGRSVLVQKTIELDRFAAALQTILNSILQNTFVLRSIQTLDPANRDTIIKEYVEFWSKQLSTTGDKTLDEKALREALIRKLGPAPVPEKK